MAICITFGTQEFTSRLQGYENVRAYCQNCWHWDGYCITRWPWFTVCFIPVLPLATHKYKEVTCARCHFTQDLSMRPDITPNTHPPGPEQPGAYGPPPQMGSQPPNGQPIPLASGADQGQGNYQYK